ncbi:MAG: hypothetical protein EOO88_42425 [Pedobacter sp.]|nr:MAG: hypothetical protein EOO88_42425 [Pedobacter sp.]
MEHNLYRMRPFLLLICISFFVLSYSNGQHCAFDGTYILAVNIKSPSGKTFGISSYDLRLVKSGFMDSDSCCSLSLPFDSTRKLLLFSSITSRNAYGEANSKAQLLKDNCFSVLLTQDQVNCLFDTCHGNQEAEIVYTYKRHHTKRYARVNRNNIYKLCTASGSWERIKPVILKVPEKEIFYGH